MAAESRNLHDEEEDQGKRRGDESMNHRSTATTTSNRPICSICYEDFKPIVEDLQSISICGHVFHELCIQQWLEYCQAGKKPTCPVCKQKFAEKDVVRLYFQSTGGGADPAQTFASERPFSDAEAEALRDEAVKLEGRVLQLSSAFEDQKKRIGELNEEVSLWKEKAKKEEVMNNACRREKESIHQLLQAKREELSSTSAECARLRERSLALAKELAALKLATDTNLEEEEVVKLASLGQGTGNADVVNVLKKSLVLRNKSYRELLAQCNNLGRAETRALKKLEKAEEKTKKLKARLRELEKAIEEKDNGILRNLKASKNPTVKGVVTSEDVKRYSDSPDIQTEDPVKDAGKSNWFGFLNPLNTKTNDTGIKSPNVSVSMISNKNDTVATDLEIDACFFIDEDDSLFSPNVSTHSGPSPEQQYSSKLYKDVSVQSINRLRQDAQKETSTCLQTGGRGLDSGISVVNIEDEPDEPVEDVIKTGHTEPAAFVDDDFEYEPVLPVRREFSAHDSKSLAGNPCFSGGLFGSEGGNRYLGKWCKHPSSKVSPVMQASTNIGSLISVGADGRGGRIKVLRAPDRSSDKTQSQGAKRHKGEAKQVSLSQGCLQIEHFFRKR